MPVDPGDVVLLDFPGVKGSKIRPAIVISTDVYQQTRPDVIVALCTTNLAATTTPSDYILKDWSAAGLTRPTAVRMYLGASEQVEIIRMIGKLSDQDWQEVQVRIRVAIAVV